MRAQPSPEVVGRYVIHDRISSGGMASVHLGRVLGAVGFTRPVAIKRLHPHLATEPEFQSAMIDEARLASRIHHPNVVPTLDVVTADGELLLVMEYVRGESLSRLLHTLRARQERLSLPLVSAVAAGALAGLHAAHEATSADGAPLEIVHRDISPQNLLVGVDGITRVIDFGVAKAAGRLQTTREGVIKGKMAYMAPEQLARSKVTRRADVYALAVIVWEMLAGRRLFGDADEAAILGLVLSGAIDPPGQFAPGLPAELEALVMKGLALDPANRFDTAQAMADELVRAVPPASANEVGAWVRATAAEALERRASLLAAIEGSSSGVSSVRNTGSIEAVATEPQSASMSVETPARRLHRASPRRLWLAAALVVSGGVAVASGLAWRAAGRPVSPAAGAAPAANAATVSAAAAPPALELPEPSSSASAPAPHAPSTRPVSMRPPAPARASASARSAIRFTRPD